MFLMLSNHTLHSCWFLPPKTTGFLQIWHFQRQLQLDGHPTCTAANSHGQLGDRVQFGPMTSKTTNRSSVKQNGKDGSNRTYSVWFGSLEKHYGTSKNRIRLLLVVVVVVVVGHFWNQKNFCTKQQNQAGPGLNPYYVVVTTWLWHQTYSKHTRSAGS